ncbi:unnamed protein product [Heligmosomoides polygyrus]|uniref:Transposase n=1 Tax=Heligmosomoides polygyrus TaxID=6339 RepID=A0A183GPP4_HELPZ|nr:unnamed protein product [Heligmosomoides polygyrus]
MPRHRGPANYVWKAELLWAGHITRRQLCRWTRRAVEWILRDVKRLRLPSRLVSLTKLEWQQGTGSRLRDNEANGSKAVARTTRRAPQLRQNVLPKSGECAAQLPQCAAELRDYLLPPKSCPRDIHVHPRAEMTKVLLARQVVPPTFAIVGPCPGD